MCDSVYADGMFGWQDGTKHIVDGYRLNDCHLTGTDLEGLEACEKVKELVYEHDYYTFVVSQCLDLFEETSYLQ